MHNSESLYYSENNFSVAEEDDFTELFGDTDLIEMSEDEGFGEEALDDDELFSDEQIFSEQEELDDDELSEDDKISFDDEIFEDTETGLPDFDDDIALDKLANEINQETSRMNESETLDYMEGKMTEFFPALAAALPAIIDLAPKAINALNSIVGKNSSKKDQSSPTIPAAAKTSAPKPAISNTASSSTQFSPALTSINDAGLIKILQVLADLIRSPKFLELLSGMLSGKTQNITTNTGQQISGSNILGIISSLAAALAGEGRRENSESFFPEYAMDNEGSFLIDPHNALQEATLILDLINK